MLRLVRVAGDSMTPTYRSSELLLTRPATRAGAPAEVRRGDVVVFRRGALRLIKRAVGLPGDLVELEAGRLYVNGIAADRHATRAHDTDGYPRARGAYTQTWRVPAAGYFMAGDNAAVSDDSRVWDSPFVDAENIERIVTRPLLPLRLGRRAVAAGRAA